MDTVKELTGVEKKQLKIFLAVNFGLTVFMGVIMWISYHNGNDVAAFAATQMMYPAMGVILAIILTAGKEKKLPVRFFVTYLVTAVLAILLTVGNVLISSATWYLVENVVFVIGSILSWIMLLTEKKEVRDGCNLRFNAHNMKKSFLLILLFFVLYLIRLFLAGLLDGNIKGFAGLFTAPMGGHGNAGHQLLYHIYHLFRRGVWLEVLFTANTPETFRVKRRRTPFGCDMGAVASSLKHLLLQP